jgi:ABC-type enterochelin transport system permease subunit
MKGCTQGYAISLVCLSLYYSYKLSHGLLSIFQIIKSKQEICLFTFYVRMPRKIAILVAADPTPFF